MDEVGECEDFFLVLTCKRIRKRLLGRPRWADNVTMVSKQIGVNARNWDGSAKDRYYCGALVSALLKKYVNNLRAMLNMYRLKVKPTSQNIGGRIIFQQPTASLYLLN